MRKQIGQLLHWDSAAATGVVQSIDTDEQYVVTRALFPEHDRLPNVADRIILAIDIDDAGEVYIKSAVVVKRAVPWLMMARVATGALFSLYMLGVYFSRLSFYPVATYLVLAALTLFLFRWRSRKPVILLLCLGMLLCHGSFLFHIAETNNMLDPCKNYMSEVVDPFLKRGRDIAGQALAKLSAFGSLIRSSRGLSSEKDMMVEMYLPGPGSRSAVAVDSRLRVIKGVVSEVSPELGIFVMVDLDVVATGIIPREALVADFASRFVPGEEIFIAIDEITVNHSVARVDLLLVEDARTMPPSAFVFDALDGVNLNLGILEF